MSKKSTPNWPGRQGPSPKVRQDQLREYRELAADAKIMQQKLDRLREELIGRLEAGADVEPGALTVRVRRVPMRVLSGPKLIPLLGEDKVEELRLAVAPTVQMQLIVQHRGAVSVGIANPDAVPKVGPSPPADVNHAHADLDLPHDFEPTELD